MTQVDRCLERAAFTEAVAERMSVGEQREALLEIAAQWRRMADEAQARANPTIARAGLKQSPLQRWRLRPKPSLAAAVEPAAEWVMDERQEDAGQQSPDQEGGQEADRG